MSILTKTEAHSMTGRVFHTIVLLALIVGGITMVYPFLLMLSGSLRSEMDAVEMSLIPDYLTHEDMLLRKFYEVKYNRDITALNRGHMRSDYSFIRAEVPERVYPGRLADVQAFVSEVEIPHHWWFLGGAEFHRKIYTANHARLVQRMQEHYDGDLRAFGQDLGSPLARWGYLNVFMPEWLNHRYDYSASPLMQSYFDLLHERPLAERAFVSLSGFFLETVIYPRYARSNTEQYNAVHAQHIDDYQDFRISQRVPGADRPRLRDEWLFFVKEQLNVSFIRCDAQNEEYQDFLRGLHPDIQALNERWGLNHGYADFSEIQLPGEKEWIAAPLREDYRAFLASLPPERLWLTGPEFAWTDWLRQRYTDLEKVGEAHEADYSDWRDAPIYMGQVELNYVREESSNLRWDYATKNFRSVLNEIVFQGRPLMNTLIFVGFSLLLSLTLQPLGAYSLSRFTPPGTWRFILIFMATMAFPPMVGMIPQFLILRKTGLLNTYVALVLPFMVNGYLIFLLKGFFDSLPQHLYEAALIDGASEARMFWVITMSLSKPILAVVGLQTFNHAWSSFMHALLVCPDENMHVLSVWLHQFQRESTSPAVFASVLITSVPTLIIFIFAQRTIMRGIAVPSEK